MAAQVFEVMITGQFVPMGPRRMAGGIPEVYIAKEIDNTRLVKVSDPQRVREIRAFVAVAVMCFALLLTYALQHLGAIEYGYRIEAQKAQRDALVEANHSLRLEEASLRDPGRIDALARRMGLASPAVGQVVRLQTGGADSAGYMARATEIGLVTVAQ
jgi:cell division protein FtsL